VSRRLAHVAKAGEVARLALGPLILLGAGGVIDREVEVAEGSTRSGHHLLELLLLLVPEAVLLLIIALVAGVIPVVVVVLDGGVFWFGQSSFPCRESDSLFTVVFFFCVPCRVSPRLTTLSSDAQQ
jgi:hypothetical protein